MSRSKVDLIEHINRMGQIMNETCFKDGKIKDTHLDLPELATEFPHKMLLEGCDWLISIFENEFEAVRKVKALLPQETWDRYESWGCFDETQEVILLKEKLVPFRKALVGHNRPGLFKKGAQRAEEKRAKNSKKGK